MSFEEAMQVANGNERFMATAYAMNTLLIHKGIYTTEEFERAFVGWVKKKKKTPVPLTILLARAESGAQFLVQGAHNAVSEAGKLRFG